MSANGFDAAFQAVKGLVAGFQAHESHYLSPSYQEAEVRKDFIDKFFIALGWDVNHERQPNPYEQEVKVERGVALTTWQRARACIAAVPPAQRGAVEWSLTELCRLAVDH